MSGANSSKDHVFTVLYHMFATLAYYHMRTYLDTNNNINPAISFRVSKHPGLDSFCIVRHLHCWTVPVGQAAALCTDHSNQLNAYFALWIRPLYGTSTSWLGPDK